MSASIVMLSRGWRRLRSIVRAILGLACLYAQIFVPNSNTALTIAAVVLVVYSLVSLLWTKLDVVQTSLPSLFAETAFFIAFAAYGADYSGWLGAFLFFYLMAAAAIQHGWGDVCIIVGSCIAFFAFVHSPVALPIKMVALTCGPLACALT